MYTAWENYQSKFFFSIEWKILISYFAYALCVMQKFVVRPKFFNKLLANILGAMLHTESLKSLLNKLYDKYNLICV